MPPPASPSTDASSQATDAAGGSLATAGRAMPVAAAGAAHPGDADLSPLSRHDATAKHAVAPPTGAGTDAATDPGTHAGTDAGTEAGADAADEPNPPAPSWQASRQVPSDAPPAAPRPATRIPLWVDLRGVPVNKRIPFAAAAQAAGAEAIVLAVDDPHAQRAGWPVHTVDAKGVVRRGGKRIAQIMTVESPKDQARAMKADGRVVIVAQRSWRVIPLENLIAARRDRPGTLLAQARTLDDVRLFLGTLETGVHGVLLVPEKAADVTAAAELMERKWAGSPAARIAREVTAAVQRRDGTAGPASSARGDAPAQAVAPPHVAAPANLARPHDGSTVRPQRSASSQPSIRLVPGRITRVVDAGVGDRVCIDATSLFDDGEGLLVGSTARSLVLIMAETAESGYVRARPFRVNAGAVHSYLMAPGGATNYLSEIGAGDRVLAVSKQGATRELTVGRAKVERRPHTLVEWTCDSEADAPDRPAMAAAAQSASATSGAAPRVAPRVASAVLQTAETIRLVRPDGKPVAVTDLRPGDLVLVHETGEAGRHFGMAIDETVEER